MYVTTQKTQAIIVFKHHGCRLLNAGTTKPLDVACQVSGHEAGNAGPQAIERENNVGDLMADDNKVGRPWNDDELDAIIADYFVMLTSELAGQPYVKTRHSAALMSQIGRTHRSVEFKHQNISAVLDELGLPWIPGYMPKRNYQNAIFDAIDRYLTHHPEILIPASAPQTEPAASPAIFVDPPSPAMVRQPIPEKLKRLVRKFDPVERDHRNRSLGKAGEAFVVDVERHRLASAGRLDLSRMVRWVAEEDGDGAGYDVHSFDPHGHERLIEVKTTNGAARTPFFLSRNECDFAVERAADWCIYRVHLFARRPRIFTISPPLKDAVNLVPETWRASF
ncbi:MAG: protein NO VEIN domain-containing protein [Acidobacteriaceae bacterium]